jgi:hypothetical protein
MLDRGIPSHTYKYSRGVLNDNWYEDRHAPDQPLKSKPEEKFMRNVEPDINCLNANGVPAPLKRIKRNHKWNTMDVIPNDGYNETKTINKTEIQNPEKSRVAEKPKLRMINKYNIAELSLVDRPISGPKTGFGATIKTFDKEYGKRYNNTTNHDFYGAPKRESPNETVTNFHKTSCINAGERNYDPKRGVMKLSGLTSEVYNTSADPQEHTEVQRTWIYKPDPAIETVKTGMNFAKEQPHYDNANSLPLGMGEHYYHKKSTEPGAYRHLRSDITKDINHTALYRY